MMLVVVMLLSVGLTGCGEKETSGTSTEESTVVSADPSVAEASKTLDPYEVKMYFMGTKQYPETNLIEDEIAKKIKDTLNTTVKIQVFPWGDYAKKMSMIIAAGEQFDACFMGLNSQYYQNVAKGAFVDLTDLVKDKLPKFSKIINPAFLEGPKVKGKLYALPTNKEVFEAFGFEYDKEFADKIGVSDALDAVKSYADLEPILKTAKEKLPGDVFPFIFQTRTLFRAGEFDSLGDQTLPGIVRLNDDSTTVINQFESPEYLANWNLAYKYVKSGYANKDGATNGAPDYWNVRKGLIRVENMGPVPAYTGTSGQTIKRVYVGNKVNSTGSTCGAMFAFSKTAKDINRALAFFDEYATNPEIYNLVGFGIEGKHYQIIDTNTTPKRVDFLSGQDENSVGYIHSGGVWSMGGNWFDSFLGKNDPADRNDVISKANDAATTSKLIGFSFDPEPVKAELAACTTIYTEMVIPLNCGAVDPAVYAPKLAAKLKASGVDKIIAEKQKQINQWKADNGK